MTRHDDKGTDLGVLVLDPGDQSSGELLFEKKRLWLPGPHLRPMGLALPLIQALASAQLSVNECTFCTKLVTLHKSLFFGFLIFKMGIKTVLSPRVVMKIKCSTICKT